MLEVGKGRDGDRSDKGESRGEADERVEVTRVMEMVRRHVWELVERVDKDAMFFMIHFEATGKKKGDELVDTVGVEKLLGARNEALEAHLEGREELVGVRHDGRQDLGLLSERLIRGTTRIRGVGRSFKEERYLRVRHQQNGEFTST